MINETVSCGPVASGSARGIATATGLSALAGSLPGRVLGIDAGGSATRVVVLEGGEVTELPSAPPMNALLTRNLPDLLQKIIRGAGATAAGIGMPGLRSREQAARLSAQLRRLVGCPVRVTDDAHVAWLGAFGGAPGIVVIAGTGSAAVGYDGNRWARAGGHGFILGDQGSAYWIGRVGVRDALRWRDGTGGSALLHDTVVKASGSDLDTLVTDVHEHPAERGRLALLAPAITGVAGEDAAARKIARKAARHLAAIAAAIHDAIGPLPVAGAGGVFLSPVIWDRFTELTAATRPMATAAVGAALLAGAPDKFGERGYA
jgi:glucosamine kinase